jgi:hypothetical protein
MLYMDEGFSGFSEPEIPISKISSNRKRGED